MLEMLWEGENNNNHNMLAAIDAIIESQLFIQISVELLTYNKAPS